ncbi:hypothetical protein IWW48_003799 [Coemansia sp. RSA 1200]|nr:hypothetical protein IWW48_003799 [Coemansia sp. RSA 1200]
MVLLPSSSSSSSSSSRKRAPPTAAAAAAAICVPDEGITPISSKPPSPLGLEDGRTAIVGRRHRSRGGLELSAIGGGGGGGGGGDLLMSASSSTTVLELGTRRESSDSDTIGSDTSDAGTPVERLIHATTMLAAEAAEGSGSAMASGGRRAGDDHQTAPPALALWMARAARDASNDRSRWMRWMVDARVVAVLGGIAMVAPGVGYVILEKLVADDLEFHSPVLMLALVHGMTALFIELLTNRPFGLFVRAPTPMRVAPLLPLVAVYCAGVLTAQAAHRINSIHGTFQTTQCALPLAVAALLAALRSNGASSSNGARHPTVCGRLRRLVAQVVRAPATDAAPGAGKMATGGSSNGGGSNSSGRWVALPLAVALGISVWAPAYRTIIATEMVGGAPTLSAQPTGAVLAYALESVALSAASLALHALFLVGASEFISRRPGLSAAAFLRHFAPLAMLSLLVLWPAAERPLYVLQTLDARALASCAGVACLGAVALVARTAMMGAAASDGVFGVAVVMQIKPLVCLAIGWWVYGYPYSARQPAAFFVALALLALWISQRLVFSTPPRSPLLSLHHYYKPSP